MLPLAPGAVVILGGDNPRDGPKYDHGGDGVVEAAKGLEYSGLSEAAPVLLGAETAVQMVLPRSESPQVGRRDPPQAFVGGPAQGPGSDELAALDVPLWLELILPSTGGPPL